jgi:hypothetical protein
MPLPATAAGRAAAGRPLVLSLFAASLLLSIVSWYTTQQGMALYLSPWFAVLASLGVQSALLMVAWLVGVTRTGRGLLVAVYTLTALVSIAFSYVSLHTWFASRERPAEVQRRLYDQLSAAAGRSQELVAAAVVEGQKHVLALDEMAAAEKAHGYISRATDVDLYLARVREAVAGEARSYGPAYPEGQGEGLRYTAFDRHARLARQTVARLRSRSGRSPRSGRDTGRSTPRRSSCGPTGRPSTRSPGARCATRSTPPASSRRASRHTRTSSTARRPPRRTCSWPSASSSPRPRGATSSPSPSPPSST